jgi:hypothetical protein
MFVGYTDDHSAVCYRMWDPKTYSIHDTRDVVWLRCMFFPQSVVGQDDSIVVIPNPPTTLDIEDLLSLTTKPGRVLESFHTIGLHRKRLHRADDASSNAASDNDSTDSTEAEEIGEALAETQRREPKTITRSGRKVYSPQRLISSIGIRHESDQTLEQGLRTLFEQSLANLFSRAYPRSLSTQRW